MQVKPLDPRLLRYASAARRFVAASALIAVVQTAVTIAFAWVLTDAVTGAIAGRPVGAHVVGLVALAVLRGLLIAASDAAGTQAAAATGAQLRAALIAAVSALGPGWLARRNQAALAVTAGHGLDALDAYFARYVPQLVLAVIATPVLVVAMWWQDWLSALTAIITLPLIPLFLALIGMATRTVQQKQWNTLQALAVRFADTVQGLSTLRLFGRDRRAADRIEQTADDYRRETMKVLRFSFLSGFAMELLASLSVALIAVSIGFRMLAGELPLETGLFVLLLAPEAFLPIRQVGVQFHAAAEGVAATEDVFEVLDAASARPSGSPTRSSPTPSSPTPSSPVRSFGERLQDPGTDAGPDGGGSPCKRASVLQTSRGAGSLAAGSLAARNLVVRDVCVRDLPPVSLDVEPGSVTLIEGPSGAGKSSLLAALRGVATFTGTATIGGIDVRELTPAGWLAWADQRPQLMRGTVAENVALGDPAPDADGIRSALIAACADVDPDRELGVQGAGLSGGQAQRVAVARALYRHAQDPTRVLALDEPSSSLDAETEARLWASLRERADAGATILLVSHRRSAGAIADRVVSVGVSA
ncbi:MAG: thiol reductant ABC exporter subunit CydD [Microbacterium sp.]